jgi:NAD(P)H-nitrite reductase large subunit
MKHLIIGNGIAGVKAAETIRREDAKAEITLVSDENDPFYLKPMLPDYVAGRADEKRLFGRAGDFYFARNIKTVFGRSVSGIDTKKRTVVLDGASVAYDRLLIAAGADVPPAVDLVTSGHGVYVFRRLSHARKIRDAAENAQSAVVIGDGIMGLELVRALLARRLQVIFLSENKRLWPDVLDEAASELLAAMIRARGVTLHLDTRLAEIIRQGGKFVGVKTAKGDVIRADFLGLGGRFTPNLSMLDGSGIHYRRGILVGRFLNTNVPEVFAAGDVAQSPVVGREAPDVNTRWHTAWQQGAIAAMNMLDRRISYHDVVTTTSTQIFGVDFMSIGNANPSGEGYTFETGDYPVEGVGVYKKLVFKDDILVGALLLGSVSEAREIEKNILTRRKRAELGGDLMRRMFDANFPFAASPGAICPVCKLELPLGRDAKDGAQITCPACGVEFRMYKEKSGRWRLDYLQQA